MKRGQKRKTRRTRKNSNCLRGGATAAAATLSFAGQPARNGQEFSQAAVAAQPEISWPPAISAPYTTLIMYDPDAPQASWLHWLQMNGKTLVPWAPPSPPKGSGTHRYYFSVYTHQAPLTGVPSGHPNFDIAEFVKKNSAVLHASTMIRVSAQK